MPWPPFAVARATTGQSHRPYQPRSAHGRDSDHVPTSRHWLKGKPDDERGDIFRSRVSAVGYLVRVFRCGRRFRKSVICHRFSHLPLPGGGWQLRVAGGRPDPFSPPFSPQRSPLLSPPILPLPSVICHRFSHRFRWQVTAPGDGWRKICPPSSIQSSIQSSTQSSTQPSIQPTPTPSSPIRPLPNPRPRPYAIGG